MEKEKRKNIKKSKKKWSKIVLGIILLNLSFTGSFCSGEEQPQILKQKCLELKLLNESLQKENAQLKQEKGMLRKELDVNRSLYADLIIQTTKKIDELQKIELQASHLVDGRDETDSLKELSEVLVFVRSKMLELEKELKACEQSWKAVLDVMQPSDVLRHEVEDRIVSLRRVFESSLKPLSLVVARRGNGDSEEPGCKVVELDLPKQILFVDKGTLQGLMPGMRLYAKLADNERIEIQIVDCRPDISAAIVVSGSIVKLSNEMRFFPDHTGK